MNIQQQAVEQHNQIRSEGQLDLISEVRRLMVESGLHHKVSAIYDTDDRIITAKDKVPEVQRHYLNKFWLTQLLNASVASQEQRTCLIPNGDPSDWMKLFKGKVLPFIIEHDLPKVI